MGSLRPRQAWGLGVVVATVGLLGLVAVAADGSPLRAPLDGHTSSAAGRLLGGRCPTPPPPAPATPPTPTRPPAPPSPPPTPACSTASRSAVSAGPKPKRPSSTSNGPWRHWRSATSRCACW